MIECTYPIYKHSERAVQIVVIRRGNADYVWLPKSVIAIENNHVVGIPKWLARSKGLNI